MSQIECLVSMSAIRNLFLKNAVANILGGAGSALFNLLLPALVVRHLGKLEFSVWTLALQILIYLQLFGFGMQIAMTKFIAQGKEIGDVADQRKTVKAGLMLVSAFVLVAILAVILLVIFYPLLFSNIPPAFVGDFRVCIFVLGVSAAWQLYALIPNGVFVGLQRNIVPVSAVLIIRMLSLLALWLVLENGGGLLALSITLATVGAFLVPGSYLFARRWAKYLTIELGAVDWGRFRELWHYCASLAVWNLAMLFVNGVDMILVGHFDFEKVAAYSLAVTFITILVGVLQAVLNPLVAIAASSFANPLKVGNLPKLLSLSSLGCSALMVVIVSVFFWIGKDVLKLWVSAEYVTDVYLILTVILIAHSIRNALMPFSIFLIAIAEQKKAFVPAVIEGVVNLCASLYLGSRLGAIGIAYATLIGATAGVLASFILVVGKTHVLTISRTRFFTHILLLPFFSLIILFLISLKVHHGIF